MISQWAYVRKRVELERRRTDLLKSGLLASKEKDGTGRQMAAEEERDIWENRGVPH